jgi:hypothetical protein
MIKPTAFRIKHGKMYHYFDSSDFLPSDDGEPLYSDASLSHLISENARLRDEVDRLAIDLAVKKGEIEGWK